MSQLILSKIKETIRTVIYAGGDVTHLLKVETNENTREILYAYLFAKQITKNIYGVEVTLCWNTIYVGNAISYCYTNSPYTDKYVREHMKQTLYDLYGPSLVKIPAFLITKPVLERKPDTTCLDRLSINFDFKQDPIEESLKELKLDDKISNMPRFGHTIGYYDHEPFATKLPTVIDQHPIPRKKGINGIMLGYRD